MTQVEPNPNTSSNSLPQPIIPLNTLSPSPLDPKYWLNTLLTMLAPIFWGTTYIVTTEYLPIDRPLFAALFRVLPAGILLTLWARQLPKSHQWPRILILSFLNISCFQALLFVAAYRLPGGIAAVIGAVQPLIIMALIWRFEHQSPRSVALLATLAAIVGMAMLLITPEAEWDTIGLLAAVLGAVSMAVGIYLTKRWKPPVSNLTFTGWQLLFGGLMLLPLAFWQESFPTNLTTDNLLGYAYLAIFGSLIAYSLWFRGIEKLPSVAVSILGAFSPITATVIGWLVLNQRLSLLQSLGFIIVLVAVFIVQRDGNKASKKPVKQDNAIYSTHSINTTDSTTTTDINVNKESKP